MLRIVKEITKIAEEKNQTIGKSDYWKINYSVKMGRPENVFCCLHSLVVDVIKSTNVHLTDSR